MSDVTGAARNDDIPPGWNANPSRWAHRAPLVIGAACGFLIAGYLALYQLRVVAQVWDPIFHDGSRRVLTSWVSRLLPIPDASLGAAVYLADAVAGAIGSTRRWRTQRWLVTVFGILAVVLGLTGLALVALQTFVLHAWCTLCLASAALSLAMTWPGTAEWRAAMRDRASAA